MTNYPADQICSPPELPPLLKNISDLKPIVGVPKNEELAGIHAVIRMAHKFSDVPEICSPTLLSQLSEHLFDAQMARYRSRYPCSIFLMNNTYTPPALPAHVLPILEPVTGAPSEQAIAKVQNALRFYQKFADIPTMFDPEVNVDLNQHLFDLQMEKYMRRSNSVQADPVPPQPPVEFNNPPQGRGEMNNQVNIGTNNAGTGAEEVQVHHYARTADDVGVRAAIERSNRLAEQANLLVERTNLLIERSNEIAERANRLVERPTGPPDRSDPLAARFNELFEKLNKHFEDFNQHSERSNHITEALKKPVAKFGDILQNINGVLVGIQHAIVRSRKENTWDALDCLVNQKGETPSVSLTTNRTSFRWILERFGRQSEYRISVVVNGVPRDYWIPDQWLGEYLRFYGIGNGLCKGETSVVLRENTEEDAREKLSAYLSSCLG